MDKNHKRKALMMERWLALRISGTLLDLIERAAHKSGVSKSEWVRARLSEAAKEELRS